MKKFLSLVLALVMTMSLVTISAGAKDFTDADKVTYTEAVEVLSAVKVIDGYTDGAFKPTNQLNRGQAAKILCNMILGPTTASALKADTAPFKDVPADSTFAAYITYCAKAGIIDGYTDGTFRPTAPLTGYAFMKLLLGALGYDKDVEGYNQPNWSINVAKQALGIGLDKGLTSEFDGTKIVTREEACLYALNTMKATMVEYDAKTNISVGGAEVVIAGSKAQDVENKANIETIKSDDKMQFAEKYFKDLKVFNDDDDFGRPARTWKLKNADIGTYAKNGDLVATFTKKVKKTDVYAAIGKTVAEDLYKGYAALYNYIDGAPGQSADKYGYVANVKDIIVEKNNSDGINGSGNGMLTEIYYDADANIVTIVSINTWVFQASTDYNKNKESVEVVAAGDTAITLADRTLAQEDFDVEDVKADDYLLITAVKDGSKYVVKSVEPAEVITGEVTGFKVQDSVTLGGEDRSYSLTTSKTGVKNTPYTVGQEAAVVLDKYGYIIAVDKAVVSSNYVYIAEMSQPSGLSTGKVVASAYFTDGTVADITIRERLGSTNKSAIKGASATANAGWYTYSKNTAGEYTLYAIETKYAQETGVNTYSAVLGADNMVTENNKVYFLGTANQSGYASLAAASMKANDDTIIIVDDGSDVFAYTGVKNIPDITLFGATGVANVSAVYSTKTDSTLNYAAYVFIALSGDATVTGGADTKLTYVMEYDGQYKTTDNDVYYTYKTLVDGEKEVIRADAKPGVLGSGKTFKAFYKARNNADGELTSISAIPARDGKFFSGTVSSNVITYNKGTLNLAGTGYTLTDDAKITVITLGKVDALSADARELNKDKDATYEAAVVTGKELGDMLKDYTIDAHYEGKSTENNGSVVEELFVTVTKVYTGAVVPPAGGVVAPVTELSGVDLTIRLIDSAITNAKIANAAKPVLAAEGYTYKSYNAITHEITATDENGNEVYFDTSVEQYWTITVDGDIKEYVADGDNSTVLDGTQAALTGKGTGYVLDNATTSFVAYNAPNIDSVANPVVITTGYATVSDASYTVNTDDKLTFTTLKTLDDSKLVFKAADGLTATYEVLVANAVTGAQNVTLALTGGTGAVISNATQTMTETAYETVGSKLTWTINTSALTANITNAAVTAVDVPVSYTVAAPVFAGGDGDAHNVKNGLTVTAVANKTEGINDTVVTVTVTIVGQATAGTTLTIGGTHTDDESWGATVPAGVTPNSDTELEIADGTNYIDPVTVKYTFTVDAGDAAPTITLANA